MRMEEKIKKATEYMKRVAISQGRDWISPTEIGEEVMGGHSAVGSPICKKMVEQGIVERSEKGHYRLLVIDA